MKKLIGFVLLLILNCTNLYSQTNTIDQRYNDWDMPLIKISIFADTMAHNYLVGNTIVFLKAKNNVDTLYLDLVTTYGIDSLFLSGQIKTNYSFRNDTLAIPVFAQIGDTLSVHAFYQGHTSNSYFGGIYIFFKESFNVGVALNTSPHSYGRAWFPCFDNFVTRSKYEFDIKTPNVCRAYCNGILTGIDTLPGDTFYIYHWKTQTTIPSYLASYASADFEEFKDFWVNSLGDTVEINLNLSEGSKSSDLKIFTHLKQILDGFEKDFGPQPFERIGFNVVSFGGGAMEHPSNITFPWSATQGGIDYEYLWGHELSHHWWGDHVTCANAEDMWLNEGWASWCESRFNEILYGSDEYTSDWNSKLNEALHWAKDRDSFDYALSPMPQRTTYGTTIYKKGAIVVVALRQFMGDSAFFNGVKAYQKAYSFKHATSYNLRDFLQNYTTKDLTTFFNQWVFQPGYPQFYPHVEWVNYTGNSWIYRVHIEQKLIKGATQFYGPIELSMNFYSPSKQKFEFPIELPARDTFSFLVELPFEIASYYVDGNDVLPDAVVSDSYSINTSIIVTNQKLFLKYSSNTLSDTIKSYWRHYWSAPDGFQPELCLNRYWDFRLTGADSSDQTIMLMYNGRNENTLFGKVDIDFFKHHGEDSLALWYRRNPDQPWQVIALSGLGSKTDKVGNFKLFHPKEGQYAIAQTIALGLPKIENMPMFQLYPNPASQYFKIDRLVDTESGFIYLCDQQGQVCGMKKWANHQQIIEWPTVGLSSGVYFLIFQSEKGVSAHLGKVVIP